VPVLIVDGLELVKIEIGKEHFVVAVQSCLEVLLKCSPIGDTGPCGAGVGTRVTLFRLGVVGRAAANLSEADGL
jgi:hypothetical protein